MRFATLQWIPILPLLIAVLIGGCARNEPRDEVETLVFSVDSTLMAENFVLEDNGIAVGFPAGWVPLEAPAVARLDSAAHVVIGEDAPVQQCLTARSDSSGQSIFALTAIKTRDTAVVARLLDRYAEAAAAQGIEMRRTRFRTGDFIVSQLLVMSADLVVFRMIFTSEGATAAVQLDWYVARSHYETLVHTIESVAGSVRRLPTNHTQGDAS
jgi:hypothetical protein